MTAEAAALVTSVITTKTVTGHPEFSVRLSEWNTQPRLEESAFQFHAPSNAKRVQFVATSCSAGR